MAQLNNPTTPQTCSRLFRPWDSNCQGGGQQTRSSTAPEYQIQNLTSTLNRVIKIENNSCSGCRDNRDCHKTNSPSPSSASMDKGKLRSFISSSVTKLTTPLSNLSPNSLTVSTALNTTPYIYPPTDSYHNNSPITQPPFHPTGPRATVFNDTFYYTPIPPAAHAATIRNVPTVGLEAYTTLMEHEYVRIIAEEAQIKAANARKQRPKKFKCNTCNVAFANNGQLKGHLRIHTGERPYKCDTCGKTFTRNEELTRHKRIHTGVRPYPCSVCGKKFGRRDHLKKHMKTHLPQERQLHPGLLLSMYPYIYGYA